MLLLIVSFLYLTLIQSSLLLSGIGLLQFPTSVPLIFLKGKLFQGLT